MSWLWALLVTFRPFHRVNLRLQFLHLLIQLLELRLKLLQILRGILGLCLCPGRKKKDRHYDACTLRPSAHISQASWNLP